METQENSVFEEGKFYLIRTQPVYPGSKVRLTPHLVVRKTKTKIVFESLLRSFDGKIRKGQDSFRLAHSIKGNEYAYCTDRYSMVPLIEPNRPCEKPEIWDSIEGIPAIESPKRTKRAKDDGRTEAKANQ